MKLLNRLVNIVILLLAIATFTMSFLLYQKREQLVKGWEKMSKAVSSTSATLDKGSNTATSAKLTPDALGHTKYHELDSLLPDLNKQADMVITQRDTLSDSLVSAAKTLELPNVPEKAKLNEVASSADAARQTVSAIEQFNNINNNVLNQVSSMGGKIGARVSVNQLKGNDAVANIGKVSSAVNALKTKSDTLSKSFSDVAKVVGGNSNFNDSAYRNSANSTISKTREMKKRHDTYKRDLDNTQSQLANARKELEANKKEITKQTRQIASLERKIERLESQMGLKTTTEAIAPSDPKLLKMLKGKVIDVNSKWDFVVLSIGSNTTVEQNKVNIPLNQDMIVVRGLNEATPEYVGKVKIVQINDNCSIANIIPESEGKKVQIGDTVYFSNATIQALTPVK
ncbi:MAG: hypothetical protein JXR78_01985 [Victivallales bacterium]|nr:hypothetical protein [Victivallales bacterium]